MEEGRTTAAVQRYLDDLAEVSGDSEAEPVIRQLLARGVRDGKEMEMPSYHRRPWFVPVLVRSWTVRAPFVPW